MCVVVYYYSDIKICGEGGGAGGRAADQRGAGAAAAARHLGLQRADSKICSTDWNRLRVCRSALVETWPMLGLTADPAWLSFHSDPHIPPDLEVFQLRLESPQSQQ